MKKLLSAMLCLLLILSLCACKDNGDDSAKAMLVRGETENRVYTNSFADLTYTAPSDWTFASNEELLSNTEHAGKLLDSERLNEIFDEIGIAYDMTCYSSDGTHSVGVLFVNNNHEEFKNFSNTDELLRAMIGETTLDTSAGITSEEVNLCGETYLRLCATTKTNTGATGYATFYGRKKASATILIVAACTDEYTVADCEACFG